MTDKLNTKTAGDRTKYLVPHQPFRVEGNRLTIFLKNGMRITGRNSDGFNKVFDEGFAKLGLSQ